MKRDQNPYENSHFDDFVPHEKLMKGLVCVVNASHKVLKGKKMADQRTRLFTINLWKEQGDDAPDSHKWRGKLQSLPDGEAYYFSEWEGLIQHLERMLAVDQEQEKVDL